MKPKNLVQYGSVIMICFILACGSAGERSEENADNTESADERNYKKEGEASAANEKNSSKDIAYASPEATEEEAPADDYDANQKPADNGLQSVFSSSAALVDPSDTIHKFVRTGDIRFRVGRVAEATYRIEDITRKYKGFVTYTSLHSRIDRTTEREISKDSLLKTSYYTVENTITIRVPASKLDTTLKEISRLVTYLDYRNLSANDVRLQILSNKLEKRRLARYNERLSKISNSGNPNYMDDKAYIEENILQKQAQEDQTLINDLSLEDQIEYATITISIYQNQEALHEVIANEENIEAYRPSVGSRMLDSLKTGWYFVEDFFVGLVAAWPLWLIIGAILLVLRKNGYLKRKKGE